MTSKEQSIQELKPYRSGLQDIVIVIREMAALDISEAETEFQDSKGKVYIRVKK